MVPIPYIDNFINILIANAFSLYFITFWGGLAYFYEIKESCSHFKVIQWNFCPFAYKRFCYCIYMSDICIYIRNFTIIRIVYITYFTWVYPWKLSGLYIYFFKVTMLKKYTLRMLYISPATDLSRRRMEWQLHCLTLENSCECHGSSEMIIINGCPV